MTDARDQAAEVAGGFRHGDGRTERPDDVHQFDRDGNGWPGAVPRTVSVLGLDDRALCPQRWPVGMNCYLSRCRSAAEAWPLIRELVSMVQRAEQLHRVRDEQ